MPSNALSQKSFSTKTPVICKPPPWPPFVPPPPLPQTTFFCFATFKGNNIPNMPDFAASCKLHYDVWHNHWKGDSKTDGKSPWLYAAISPSPTLPTYDILAIYYFPLVFGPAVGWNAQLFTAERPHVGQRLERFLPITGQRATIITRETPA